MNNLIINIVSQITNQQRSVLWHLSRHDMRPILALPSSWITTYTSTSSATPTKPDATTHTTSHHSTYLHTTSIHPRNNLTSTLNDSTTTSTNLNIEIFYTSTIANILREYNDRDRRWPLFSKSNILPRQVAIMIATNTKLSFNVQSKYTWNAKTIQNVE